MSWLIETRLGRYCAWGRGKDRAPPGSITSESAGLARILCLNGVGLLLVPLVSQRQSFRHTCNRDGHEIARAYAAART